MGEAAWANMVHAMPTDDVFLRDLGSAVANDGSGEGGARYLLSRVSDFLRARLQPDGPIAAYDFCICDVEAISELWPVFHYSVDLYGFNQDSLPALARFIVDRLPSIWTRPAAGWGAPVTRAVALADRIDTLVGMFAAGLKPNGSKDPFAVRRAANEILNDVLFPVRVAS